MMRSMAQKDERETGRDGNEGEQEYVKRKAWKGSREGRESLGVRGNKVAGEQRCLFFQVSLKEGRTR